MKRGDLVQKFANEIKAHLDRGETDMFYIAHYVMRVAEENGMFPPIQDYLADTRVDEVDEVYIYLDHLKWEENND